MFPLNDTVLGLENVVESIGAHYLKAAQSTDIRDFPPLLWPEGEAEWD